ncbi:MAG: hypothetical protein SPL05_05515 [Eubacteriales bacterium]|nr:hypothetical protein [Eubacteriales bacterium]
MGLILKEREHHGRKETITEQADNPASALNKMENWINGFRIHAGLIDKPKKEDEWYW